MTLYKNTRRFKKHSQGKPRTRIMKGGMKVKYKSGIKYDGDIKDGKANGKGKMTWTDGSVYVGEFKDDRWHGRGKMVWANGEVYVGEFKNGLKDGKGKYTWSDGEFYEGDYRDGMKNGKGKYSWTDGRVYVGEWLDDKKNGRGKMRFLIGAIYDGNWENDQMQTFTPLLQDDDVSNLAFHPSEPLLLSLCRSKNPKEPQTLFLQRFNRTHGVLDQIPIAQSLQDRTGPSIAFHPKAPIFVVGDGNGELHLFKWEINLSEGLSAIKMSTTTIDPRNINFRKQCELIAFHPSEPLFATYGESYRGISNVRLWRIKRVKSTNSFELEDLRREIMAVNVSCIAFHPTQPILITACGSRIENNVKLWNYFEINEPYFVNFQCAELVTILSSLPPNDEHDLRSAFNSDYTSFHTDFVSCVAFHPTEPFFVTGSKDTTIKMWRMIPKPDDRLYVTCVVTCVCVTTFRPEVQSPVTSIAFHPTAPLLVGGYHNGNAILWSYIGFLTKKVLTIDPMMYEEYGLTLFPPPPPPPLSRRGVTPAMLTEMRSKLHIASSDRGKDDTSDGAAGMMKSSSGVPVSMAARLELDESPPPPSQRLIMTQLNASEMNREEKRRHMQEIKANSGLLVSSVNFQVDSSKVTFLEIGRRNTNVVELQNVSHFVSSAENTARERNKQFESRVESVQAFADNFTHPSRRLFSRRDVRSALLRQPVSMSGAPGAEFTHDDKEWEETLKMRVKGDLVRSGRRKSSSSSSGESKGGYKSRINKSRRKNVTRRLRKYRRGARR